MSKSDAAPPPTQSTTIPVKLTTKMIARAQYERTLQNERQETPPDETTLQVYASDSSKDSTPDLDEKMDAVVEHKKDLSLSSKRRRPPTDPFTGIFLP